MGDGRVGFTETEAVPLAAGRAVVGGGSGPEVSRAVLAATSSGEREGEQATAGTTTTSAITINQPFLECLSRRAMYAKVAAVCATRGDGCSWHPSYAAGYGHSP